MEIRTLIPITTGVKGILDYDPNIEKEYVLISYPPLLAMPIADPIKVILYMSC